MRQASDYRDLLGATLATIAAGAVLLSGVSGPLAVLFGLSLTLFLTGFALSAAVITEQAPPLERIVWAVGLSLVISASCGLVLGVVGGLDRLGWILALLGITATCLVVAGLRRRASVRVRRAAPAGIYGPAAESGWRRTAMVPLALAGAILLGIFSILWSRESARSVPPAQFTELTLVPTDASPDGELQAELGVTSRESGPRRFRIVLRADGGGQPRSWSVALGRGESWTTVVPAPAGRRLTAEVFLGPGKSGPYRRVELRPPVRSRAP